MWIKVLLSVFLKHFKTLKWGAHFQQMSLKYPSLNSHSSSVLSNKSDVPWKMARIACNSNNWVSLSKPSWLGVHKCFMCTSYFIKHHEDSVQLAEMESVLSPLRRSASQRDPLEIVTVICTEDDEGRFRSWNVRISVMRCENGYVRDYPLISGFVSLVDGGATDVGEGAGLDGMEAGEMGWVCRHETKIFFNPLTSLGWVWKLTEKID